MNIHFHSSSSPEKVLKKQLRFLKKGIIDPSLHYHSLNQAKAWSRVFQKHCPVVHRTSFQRVYRDIFKEISLPINKKIHLIGLGCGVGTKEELLAKTLFQKGALLDRFTAVDVSADLCLTSMNRLKKWTHLIPQSWVMDLDFIQDFRKSLDRCSVSERRLYTFFGLVPNFEPQKVLRLFRKLLRPQDRLLVSAHLNPVDNRDESDSEAGMMKILPQYQNRETKRWLELFFNENEWDRSFLSELKFKIQSNQQYHSILVESQILKSFTNKSFGKGFTLKKGMKINVFESRRWTPMGFEKWVSQEGFKILNRKVTPCREEGVWEISLR